MDKQKLETENVTDDFEPDMDDFYACIDAGDMAGAMDCFGDRDPMEFI